MELVGCGADEGGEVVDPLQLSQAQAAGGRPPPVRRTGGVGQQLPLPRISLSVIFENCNHSYVNFFCHLCFEFRF